MVIDHKGLFYPPMENVTYKPSKLVHKYCKLWGPHNQHKGSIAITSNNFFGVRRCTQTIFMYENTY